LSTSRNKPKKAKPYNWDTKIMSALRRIWRYSPERKAALDAATVGKDTVRCGSCGQETHKKLAAVDHVETVVPLAGFQSWDETIARMKSTKLMVLCCECHSKKTKDENEKRRALKKLLKASYRKSNLKM
jgi:5-methylcytosine-specific restriction endonuclease McrA